MLYKPSRTDERFASVEPVAFRDFASFGQREKDLEDLIAQNLFEVLFEDERLMPVYQQQGAQAREAKQMRSHARGPTAGRCPDGTERPE